MEIRPERATLRLRTPAKLNLFLAITGRRADGFHDLLSVALPIDLADVLEVTWRPGTAADTLTCGDPAAPSGPDNLVHRALQALRARVALPGHFRLRLRKRIPVGAGLGGGSSNAAGMLLAARQLFPALVDAALIAELAATIGADCSLFLQRAPVLMEGRGERCQPLPPALRKRLGDLRLYWFRPEFAVATAEAYRRLAALRLYTPPAQARALLADWLAGADPRPLPPAHNDFARLASHWLPSLHLVLAELNRLPGVDARLSGSGSACFALLPAAQVRAARRILRQAWGANAGLRSCRATTNDLP